MKRHLSFALPLLLLIGPTALLEAHAILLSADPAPNATVHAGTVQVHLRFNARIDARRSRLTLINPGRGENRVSVDQPQADSLKSALPKLEPGSYILRWQVLAEDGHITRGELPFRVQ
jgi:methionine-rich copper-binding protein CopC